jgi:hypothetical protein
MSGGTSSSDFVSSSKLLRASTLREEADLASSFFLWQQQLGRVLLLNAMSFLDRGERNGTVRKLSIKPL